MRRVLDIALYGALVGILISTLAVGLMLNERVIDTNTAIEKVREEVRRKIVKSATWKSGGITILIEVSREPGQSDMDWQAAFKSAVDTAKADFPPGD